MQASTHAAPSPITIRTDLPIIQQPPQQKSLTLPRIELPRPQERAQAPAGRPRPEFHEEEMRKFEDAISSMSINVMHSEAPHENEDEKQENTLKSDHKGQEYYRPAGLGEGYFSEIEHYLKNKDMKEIVDDIITKDFLTNMKDYHDLKAQGKPFYLHNEDLKKKLEQKMNSLKLLEEEWHELKREVEDKQKRQVSAEKDIDEQSKELKELFRLTKINYWLEHEAQKEHYFKLANGQLLKNLNDLRKALTYMTEDEFKHHVNEHRNDFSIWTKEALQNPILGAKMMKAKTKEELQEILKSPLD
jgi:hypothetical protein